MCLFCHCFCYHLYTGVLSINLCVPFLIHRSRTTECKRSRPTECKRSAGKRKGLLINSLLLRTKDALSTIKYNNVIMESDPENVELKDDTFKTKCCTTKSITTVTGWFLLINFKLKFLPYKHYQASSNL